MVTNQTLRIKREVASKASKGTSGEPIYQVFEQVIEKLDLNGNLLDFGAGQGNLAQRFELSKRFDSIIKSQK